MKILGWFFRTGVALAAFALVSQLANMTADRNTLTKPLGLKSYPVAASTTIYKGTMVCVNTAGYAVPAVNTVNFKMVGIADTRVDNSAGGNGAQTINVNTEVLAFVDATGPITQANVGTTMYVSDDHTVTATAGNGVIAGTLVEFISGTSGWIQVASQRN